MSISSFFSKFIKTFFNYLYFLLFFKYFHLLSILASGLPLVVPCLPFGFKEVFNEVKDIPGGMRLFGRHIFQKSTHRQMDILRGLIQDTPFFFETLRSFEVIQSLKIFPKRYCESLLVKGLQSCSRSNFEDDQRTQTHAQVWFNSVQAAEFFSQTSNFDSL